MEAVEAEGEGGFGAVAVGDEVGQLVALFQAQRFDGVAPGFGAVGRGVVEGEGLFVGDGGAQLGEEFGRRGVAGGQEGVAALDDGLEVGQEAVGLGLEDGYVVGGQGGGQAIEIALGDGAGQGGEAR